MKHRALSMLLALLMVVSLLPVAAIANGAEENTGAEEQEETVEMGENDSQQGGDGETDVTGADDTYTHKRSLITIRKDGTPHAANAQSENKKRGPIFPTRVTI